MKHLWHSGSHEITVKALRGLLRPLPDHWMIHPTEYGFHARDPEEEPEMDDERTEQIIQMSKEIDAMNTLLESDWWLKDLEDGNYHSTADYMKEQLWERTKERNAA